MPNVKLATGCDLYYESHGQGEPLIFVPSTAYSGEVWKPWQMPLAKSLNVIFHDPRGCGRSVPTQELYTIEQMALDIAALMDHLKIPSAHLIGHSMGGQGAWHLGLQHTGRWGAVESSAGYVRTYTQARRVIKLPLPAYQVPGLTIYDVDQYALNAFNVPTVAYIGETDGNAGAYEMRDAWIKEGQKGKWMSLSIKLKKTLGATKPERAGAIDDPW